MTDRIPRRAADLSRRADSYQRAHRWLGFPLAVVRKYTDDHGGYLAALLAYYGFVSVYPLLLILVTVLGFALSGAPWLQQRLLHTAIGDLPLISDQVHGTAQTLHGSVTALFVGALVSTYGGLRFARAGQYVLNRVWSVPQHAWPNAFRVYARAMLLVAGLGLALVVTTALSGLSTAERAFGGALGGTPAMSIRVLAIALALVIDTAVFVLAFRVLTARKIPLRDLRAGAFAAAVGWQVLQEIGTYYIAREHGGVNAAYGMFGIVLVLLAWTYLGAVIVVLAAELNAVRADRLWPRALLREPAAEVALTRADRRAYASYATAQRYIPEQRVVVTFGAREAEPERTAPNLPLVD
jgi:YihY family inner membrane protein